METLGQDRLRNLNINYRRNKIKLVVLASVAGLLLFWALFLYLRICSIRSRVTEEYTPAINQAYEEMQAAEALRQETSDYLTSLKEKAADLEARLEQVQE